LLVLWFGDTALDGLLVPKEKDKVSINIESPRVDVLVHVLGGGLVLVCLHMSLDSGGVDVEESEGGHGGYACFFFAPPCNCWLLFIVAFQSLGAFVLRVCEGSTNFQWQV